MRYYIVGCGLSGAVVARELAERGEDVTIFERRSHIGGNMYDYVDPDSGYLVQMYGPHTFHTNDSDLFGYMSKYSEWDEYTLRCGAFWDGQYTPTPFNFTTIDTFYTPEDATILKEEIAKTHPERETITVLEALNDNNPRIREYAMYLFEKDYRPYTSKQWGLPPSEIDPSVLKRVPIRFSYKDAYFDDKYQVMPRISFTSFFERILDHPNITVELNVDALDRIAIGEGHIDVDGHKDVRVIYTGALDELFGYRFGSLPYRSLTFELCRSEEISYQPAPVVAYPQDKDIVRITEYSKLPYQEGEGTIYVKERSFQYGSKEGLEPYYPVLTEASMSLHDKYMELAKQFDNLLFCGRLADFRYYNMDQALLRALNLSVSL